MTKKSKDLNDITEDEFPSFEEISNPESVFFDPRWFESELMPDNHEWAEVIGDFLFMRDTVRRYEYTGKNRELSAENRAYLKKFKELIPEIEHFIRYGMDGLEFAQLWAEFKKIYYSMSFIKREEKNRAKRGQYDRGAEARKAWYALVYLQERAKGKTGATIKREIAKFAEHVKAGKIPPPRLWKEMGFDKILHKDSRPGGLRLNVTLDEEMNVKKDIPYYAHVIAPTLSLPPIDIKIPAQ